MSRGILPSGSKSLTVSFSFWVTAALFGGTFALVSLYGVNIPFYDEWEFLSTHQLSPQFSPRWLFAQSSEHRVVISKLVTWFLYRLNGWNIAQQLQLNVLIFGLLTLSIIWFLRKYSRNVKAPYFFIPFLFSPALVSNHLWAIQGDVHFYLLFFVLGTGCLFDSVQRWRTVIPGVIFLLSSQFSFGSGLIASLSAIVFYTLFKSQRVLSRSFVKRELYQLLFFVFSILGGIILYVYGYTQPSFHPHLSWPWQESFWDYFLNLSGGAFGYESRSMWLGILSLGWIVCPLILFTRGKGHTDIPWAILTIIVGLVAVMVATAVGRADFGALQAKKFKYAETGLVLLPFVCALWSYINSRLIYRTVMVSMWGFCFLGYSNNWDFSIYAKKAFQRRKAQECVSEYFTKGILGSCKTAHPRYFKEEWLGYAKELKLSFYRELTS